MSTPGTPDTVRGDSNEAAAKRVGIFTTDAELVVKSWDATLEQMTGIAAERARGRALHDLVPDLAVRGLSDILREPLVSGAAQVLAPALHKYLIPCPPLEPSNEFERMQQRVVVGALRDETRAVGLVVAVEDVTSRLEHERALARQLRDSDPATRMAAVERLSRLESPDGIGALGHAMGDTDWQVRRSAVRALAARRDASLVEAVVTALRDGHRDFSLLSSALQLLALTGVDLTTALIGLLSDPDSDLRLQAALALGSQRGAAAVSALLAALDDPDTNVRFHAVEALGKLGAPEARDRLVVIAESRDFFLAFAALEALGRISDPSIAPRLTPLLADVPLAAQVAEVLGQIGDEFTIQPLVEALNEDHAPVAEIAAAIAHIHQRHSDLFGAATEIEDSVARMITPGGAERVLQALPRASGPSLRGLVVVLGWMKGEAIQRALAQLVGASGVHRDVIEGLVRFGSPAVDVLIEQLSNDDLETRRAAAIGLGRIGDRRAVPALVGLLAEESSSLTVAVAGALARIGDGRAFDALLALVGDPDAAVRQAAIGALNSIGHPAMASRIHALLGDDNPHVRESAVRIAGYFGYAACVDELIARCRDDDDETVRAAALEHLPFLDDSRVLDTLRHALTSDTPRARGAAAHALGGLDVPEAASLLERAAADDDAWVRYFAAISIGRRGEASLLPLLERLATSDPARHVRVVAIEAVGAIGGAHDGRALRILAPFATAGEADLANAAVRALGRVRSAGVLAPLSQAMRATDPRRRAVAAEALVATNHPDAVDLLRWTASADGDPDVARAAMNALATLAGGEGPAGRGAVQALAATTAEASRQGDAVRALSRIPPSALPWLAEQLAVDDPNVRRSVVEALGRMSHPVASAYLQRAMEDGDAVVRRRAVAALSRLGTRGIARRLTIMARTDPSPVVREAATAALARQGNYEDPGSDAPR